jgi:carboxypeptidase T
MSYKALIVSVLLAFSFQAKAGPTRYDDVKTALQDILQKFPQNATPVVIGDSDSGQQVVALAIGHGATHNLIVATHHGNEYGSTSVVVNFARALAQDPIPDQTVFVVPVLNISGYNANSRREVAQGTTFDPNRDYPGPCATEGPYKLKSTLGLAKFIDAQNIVASATLHTFYPAVVYPWGMSTHDTGTAYDPLFIMLAQAATAWSH